MRRVLALTLAVLLPLPTLAHPISVFATVTDGVVTVEARFADGSPVKAGTLTVRDATDAVILTAPVDGVTALAFPVGTHTDGLTVEVDAGGGHSNYWVLTPNDLAP